MRVHCCLLGLFLSVVVVVPTNAIDWWRSTNTFRSIPTTTVFALFLTTARRPGCCRALVSSTTTRSFFSVRQMDPFGDDSFLDDFDVDAAIRQRQQKSGGGGVRRHQSSLALSNQEQQPSPSKRTKLLLSSSQQQQTPSPTALHASSYPFQQNSCFSTGTKTNPAEFTDYPDTPSSSSPTTTTPTTTTPTTTPTKTTTTPTKSVVSVTPPPAKDPLLTAALEKTLHRHYGHSRFRRGQLEVIQAVLEKRDAAVFWATGSGKSLCYQIPALHTDNKTAIVVSPLISLMQDQVAKLNGQGDRQLATFLGSGQPDPTQETKALRGEFPLVYVTPEKLLSNGFLEQLADLHSKRGALSLFAVDESHCVSEWGHDFRPEYRRLHRIRSDHAALANVPLLALTATAVPAVQHDIVSSLKLRPSHYLDRQSLDRDNLRIQIFKKHRGGMRATLETALEELRESGQDASTVIYAPTRDLVEEIASFLESRLSPDVPVMAYHAGLSPEQRSQAHTSFLVGQTPIIVATVAFGMGIDKPDIRRVWHYGPPKTMEEYFQQIGRAGRDGRPSECRMWVSDGDFDRYQSGFYTDRLPPKAKQALGESLRALRSYALDLQACRRRALLEFFDEQPPFERCGTCDTCVNQQLHRHDLERDFSQLGALVVLRAAAALEQPAMGVLEKVVAGKIVEPYRYRPNQDEQQVQKNVLQARTDMGKRRPASYFRELIAPMVSKGYLAQQSKSKRLQGFSRTWSTYEITNSGMHALSSENVPIVLPVPPSLRDIEKEEEEKRQKILSQLVQSGIKLEDIPKEEAEAGEGDAIRAFQKWNGYLESLRQTGRRARLAQLETLKAQIEQWRSETAVKTRMAPAATLASHVVVLIAYTVATMRPGTQVEREALYAAGARSRELDSLVTIVNEWSAKNQPAQQQQDSASTEPLMVLPDEIYTPSKPWEYAVYKPKKTTKLATWESSHSRFLDGEHPQTIAMSPTNGRPIQVSTVVGHILDGLVQGRAVPLERLSSVSEPPNKAEWEQLLQAEAQSGMSVVGDPMTSGVGGEKFTMTAFLRPIMGDHFLNKPYQQRTPAEKGKFAKWCRLLQWYMALRRVGYEPSFERRQG